MPNKIKIDNKDIQFMFKVIVSINILTINSFKTSKELNKNFEIISFYLLIGKCSIFIDIEELSF